MRKWIIVSLAIFSLLNMVNWGIGNGNLKTAHAQDGDCPENPWDIYPTIGDLMVVDEPGVSGYNRIDGRELETLILGSIVEVVSSSTCDNGNGWVEVNYQGENYWVVYVNNPTFSALSGNSNTTYYLLPSDYPGSVLDVTERNERCPIDNFDLDLQPGLIMVVDEPDVFTFNQPYGEELDKLEIGTAVTLTRDLLCYDTELWSSATLNGNPIWVKLFDNNTRISVAGGVVITYHFMPQGDPRADYQGDPITDQPSTTAHRIRVRQGFSVPVKDRSDGSGTTLTTLRPGDVVTLMETIENGNITIAQVRYGNQTGWVLMSDGSTDYFEPVD